MRLDQVLLRAASGIEATPSVSGMAPMELGGFQDFRLEFPIPGGTMAAPGELTTRGEGHNHRGWYVGMTITPLHFLLLTEIGKRPVRLLLVRAEQLVQGPLLFGRSATLVKTDGPVMPLCNGIKGRVLGAPDG